MNGADRRAPSRVVGVDVARALASLIMVQGHAYHAWVAAPYRSSDSYAFTRLLGSLPLPAFLLLAGTALGLRVRAAQARGEAAHAVRASLMRRGGLILAWGYAVNLAFALLDGFDGLATLLRADVLHVIGVSLLSMAWLGVRAPGNAPPSSQHMRRSAVALTLLPSLLCAWLTPLGSQLPELLRPLLAPWIEVPGWTRMPWLPLVAWLALGTWLSTLTPRRAADCSRFQQRAGVPMQAVALLAAGALGAAVAGSQLTAWAHQALGGELNRAHPAVIFNVLDLSGRACLVLAAGLLLGGLLPERWGRALARVGQSSLWIYVAHLPFCYGRPGRPLFHQLSMAEASLWLVPLMIACLALVPLRLRFQPTRRTGRSLAVS